MPTTLAVVLEEVGGTRRLLVVITAIGGSLLSIFTWHALGGWLVEARITRTDGQTMYTSAIVSGCHGTQVVDARPSDEINLALRVGAPIRVEPAVLEAMQATHSQGEPPAIKWA